MSHFGAAVEYALHILTQLARLELATPPSAKALAKFQGVPPAYLAKVMTRLEKAGLVTSLEGKGGGYLLGRPSGEITFLDVAEAVDGRKSIFECTEVRRNCVLYEKSPPKEAVSGICAIHAVMIAAESSMRLKLSQTTIADIAIPMKARTSQAMKDRAHKWFSEQALRKPRRSG